MNENDKAVFAGCDRRLSPRHAPSDVPFLESVILDTISKAQVLNISREGLLIETSVRLRPRTIISLEIVTNKGVYKTNGLVLRCNLVSVKEEPIHQVAIFFEHPFQMMDDLENDPANQYRDTKFPAPEDWSPIDPKSVPMAPGAETNRGVIVLLI
jgi:hypothetical protein